MPAKTKNLKVVIVGGSIAGLTLALCLQEGGIDFVVLEAHDDIAPQVGASIGILPNGARILDQLGAWDGINELIVPTKHAAVWTDDGKLITGGNQSAKLHERFGYPVAFLDRQLVLKVLADKIADPSKIKLGAKVLRVDHSANGVVIYCKDGTSYAGDIVAGADGIHSTIRKEMWRYSDSKESSPSIEKDKKALTSEYRCLFGISNAVPGLSGAIAHRTFSEGWSSLVIIGKNERCFWFIFEKQDRRYQAHEIPRFNEKDKENFVNKFSNRLINDNTKFGALWKQSITSHLVSLEEAQHEHWTVDRFVCLGDSIHKMTPNMGQGGNSAIESAASLSNQLTKLQNSGAKVSLATLETALQDYQTDRHTRASNICNEANSLTRLEAMNTFKDKIISKYVLPHVGDLLLEQWTDTIIGATKVDFLPQPANALSGNGSFKEGAGLGHKESKIWRASYALPLLVTSFCAMRLFADILQKIRGPMTTAYVSSAIPSLNGTSTAIRATYYGMPEVDAFLKTYVLAFTPSIANMDLAHRYQSMAFMADLIPIQAIWAIESARVGNSMTFISVLRSMLECAYQVKGIGFIAPLYFFLHYIQTPQENYHAAENRIVSVPATKAIISSLFLGYVIPTFAMYSTLLSVENRQIVNAVWQTFPVWTLLLSHFLNRSKNVDQDDSRMVSTYNRSILRFAYIFSGSLSALVYVYIRLRSPFPMSEIFFSDISSPSRAIGSVVEGFGRFLRYDHIFAFGSGLFWQLLHFKDLKTAGKLDAGWHKIVGVMGLATLLFGPGAAMALGWAWREEVMAGTKWAIV